MKQQKQIDKELLHLYFKGMLNKEQLKTVKTYIGSPEYRESLHDFFESEWKNMPMQTEHKHNEDIHYKKFLSLIAGHNNRLKKSASRSIAEPEVNNRTKQGVNNLAKPGGNSLSKRISFMAQRIAVAAAITGIIGLYGWKIGKELEEWKRDAQWVTVKNEAGERSQFWLPDSTVVHLGAASTIQYNKNYGLTNRQLKLEGEGYFIVNQKQDPAFSVVTGDIITVDIGTEFNIRALRDHAPVEITVAKGSVEVYKRTKQTKNKITALQYQEQLRYDPATEWPAKHALSDKETIGGWRNGLLAFREQTLAEVAEELERFYDTQIGFEKPELSRILITTTLDNTTLAQALEIIAITASVAIDHKEGKIMIR